MSIIGTKEDKGAVITAVALQGEKTRGEAVATTLIAHVKDESGKLKRFLMDILALSMPERSAFRKTVAAHVKEINAHAKAAKGTPDELFYKRTAASATVRLSECKRFSEACDLGFGDAIADMPYTAAVTAARQFLESMGEGDSRGRKSISLLDKVKAIIAKYETTPAMLNDVAQMVQTMAQIKAHQQSALV